MIIVLIAKKNRKKFYFVFFLILVIAFIAYKKYEQMHEYDNVKPTKEIVEAVQKDLDAISKAKQ